MQPREWQTRALMGPANKIRVRMPRLMQHPHYFHRTREAHRAIMRFRAPGRHAKVGVRIKAALRAAEANAMTDRLGDVVEVLSPQLCSAVRTPPQTAGELALTRDLLLARFGPKHVITWKFETLECFEAVDVDAVADADCVGAHLAGITATYYKILRDTAGMKPRRVKAEIRANARRWLAANLVALNHAMLASLNPDDELEFGSIAGAGLRCNPSMSRDEISSPIQAG